MDLPGERVCELVARSGDRMPPLDYAHLEMWRLEAGAKKNRDENRSVTHFTDRVRYADSAAYREVEEFAEKVRSGALQPGGRPVEFVVVNGIGGSALGPQLVQFAINGPYWNELSAEVRRGYPGIYFLDNTDSAGLVDLRPVVDPAAALVINISKSGATRETMNNMLAFEQSFGALGLDFARHAVAITMPESKLGIYAREHNWLASFPMSESVGGRTSETSVVGHVPAALTGIDFASLLAGARRMDELTRSRGPERNPAYQLAVAWHVAGNGRGDRNMVIVPYSDRLLLLGRYLQQLVMESLGKERDLDGKIVNQGLTVFGNKGGTDAHAYIQQLNDGRDDFFVTFVEVLRDSESVIVEDALTMGDYLHAFKSGLAQALRGKGRQVIEIVIRSVDEYNLGMLTALYERAVAVYAELIHVNAFDQPGVEAYKNASRGVISINRLLQGWIAALKPLPWEGTAQDVAGCAGCADSAREVEGVLGKFAENGRRFGGTSVTRTFPNGDWLYAFSEEQ